MREGCTVGEVKQKILDFNDFLKVGDSADTVVNKLIGLFNKLEIVVAL
jgi:hypothetical protein